MKLSQKEQITYVKNVAIVTILAELPKSLKLKKMKSSLNTKYKRFDINKSEHVHKTY